MRRFEFDRTSFWALLTLLILANPWEKDSVEAKDVLHVNLATSAPIQDVSSVLPTGITSCNSTVNQTGNGIVRQKCVSVGSISLTEEKTHPRGSEGSHPTSNRPNPAQAESMDIEQTTLAQVQKNDSSLQTTAVLTPNKVSTHTNQIKGRQTHLSSEKFSKVYSCLLDQSRKEAGMEMDLPQNVRYYLGDSERTETLKIFEVISLPQSCGEALCHPAVRVSFRIITNTTSNSTRVLMVMYGQAASLLDHCRAHLQARQDFHSTADSQGNLYFQIYNDYNFIFLQNQSCHYGHSLDSINALTTMLALQNPPPPCLQNILCSPFTTLNWIPKSPDHYVWIPVIEGHLPTQDLIECSWHFQGSQHQESPLTYFTITPGRRKHDMVIFNNTQCYAKQPSNFLLHKVVGSGKLPLPSCFPILCDQRFRFGFYPYKNFYYAMVFGEDSAVLSPCRSQLSVDSRSIRTYAIKGYTFPLFDEALLFLPDSDCFSGTLFLYAHIFLSIVVHNVTIPQPCETMLCSPTLHLTTIGKKEYISYLSRNNLTNSCFEALNPNPKTNDSVRFLSLSPKLDLFQISPSCNRLDEVTWSTSLAYGHLLASTVSFPLSCYSHFCHGGFLDVKNMKDAVNIFYVVGSSPSQGECYLSLKTSVPGTKVATNSENCSFVILSVTKTEEEETVFTVSHPKCQIADTRFPFFFTSVQHMDMLMSLYYHGDVTEREFFECIAEKIPDFSDITGPSSVRLYGQGVDHHLPNACIRLACSPLTIASYDFKILNNKTSLSSSENGYVTVFSFVGGDTLALTQCQHATAHTDEDNSTLHSQEKLIKSQVDLRGVFAPPTSLFLVFPPLQCFFVYNAFIPRVISYFLIHHKEFPQECVEMLFCDASVDMQIVDYPEKYLNYVNGLILHKSTALYDYCLGNFKSIAYNYFHSKLGLKIMHYRSDPLYNGAFTDLIYDFSIRPQGLSNKELIAELLLGEYDLGFIELCIWCISQSLVVERTESQRRFYLVVPHSADSKYCDQCYDNGSPVTDFPDLSSLLNSERVTLFILRPNKTDRFIGSVNSYDVTERYLYTVIWHFDECARLDQNFFTTMKSFYGYNITEVILILHKDGLSCLNQVAKSIRFSCIQTQTYNMCHERLTHVTFLHFRNCSLFFSAKMEILSKLVVYSPLGSSGVQAKILDLCAPETRVTSYITHNEVFFYQVLSLTSNLSQVLAALQPRWRLKPLDSCLTVLQNAVHSCQTAINIDKINELLQSQTGVAVINTKGHRVSYQCITYKHPNATLRLFNLILINDILVLGGESPCKESFKTNGQKFLGILQNGTYSTWVESAPSTAQTVAKPNDGFQPLPISSCPALMNNISFDIATISVAQNNTLCLQDLCNGTFHVFNDDKRQMLAIGPLGNSLYRSPCFESLPPGLWKRVNQALQSGHVTLNKFWPGCFYDHVIIYHSSNSKVDDWAYLSTPCKVREVIYFIIELVLTIITIVGNFVVIYTLFYHKRMREASCRLRINLAFADLLVGLFVQSRALHNHISVMTGEITLYKLEQLSIYKDFQDELEKAAIGFHQIRFLRTGFDAFSGFVFSVTSFVSLTFMSLMSLERLLMTAYLEYHPRIFIPERLTWLVLGTWFGGFVFAILLLQKESGHDFVAYFDPLSKVTTSLPSGSIRSVSFIIFYATAIFFSLTTILVVVVSVLTFWNFATVKSRLRRQNISYQAPVGDTTPQKLRIILTVFVTAYLISCVPLVVGSAFNIFLISPTCHQIMWWVYLSSSAVNCYLYNLRRPEFRKDIGQAFYCITFPLINYVLDLEEDVREHWRLLVNIFHSFSERNPRGSSNRPQQMTSSL